MKSSSGAFVLDTSILVLYARWGDTAKLVEQRFGLITASVRPMVCEVSVGEMRSLALKLGWGSLKIQQFENLLFGLSIIYISQKNIYQTYAELDNYAQNHGCKMGKNDLWIAAATSATSSTLLTGDKDFDTLASGSMLSRVLIDIKTGTVAER